MIQHGAMSLSTNKDSKEIVEGQSPEDQKEKKEKGKKKKEDIRGDHVFFYIRVIIIVSIREKKRASSAS
jgi:hypothetical protein